ncbi:MAG: hypothetical protein J07HQW1_01965 [Haloquadratum walsbyi J07HQW1]|uniref:Uncharacterized protein n=1 Tax=Haloquadratum walsbyi J07HQW1 TaxID=1238424 RepID=U1PIE6_9EURY|nr:MAG: hypothetical protein J07HQW1_01965 [Haloquadratum walsbyi J07HQW1]
MTAVIWRELRYKNLFRVRVARSDSAGSNICEFLLEGYE